MAGTTYTINFKDETLDLLGQPEIPGKIPFTISPGNVDGPDKAVVTTYAVISFLPNKIIISGGNLTSLFPEDSTFVIRKAGVDVGTYEVVSTFYNSTTTYTEVTVSGTVTSDVVGGFVLNTNQCHTPLHIFGQGFLQFGEKANENFIRLLENFTSSVPPIKPTIGQLWFDSVSNNLKVLNMDREWVGVGGVTVVQPTTPQVGQTWFNTIDSKLYVWDGVDWKMLFSEIASGDLDMENTRKVINLPTPTNNADAVTKQYVDTNLASIIGGNLTTKVSKSGDTMTGPLYLYANATTSMEPVTLSQMSTVLSSHIAASDPHPGYLTPAEASGLYEASGTATTLMSAHTSAVDPHPTYLTSAEASGTYEPVGTAAATLAAHTAAVDPHPTYLTAAEGTTLCNAIVASSPQNGFGYNQTWQNVTGSRVGGTWYQNTTGKPIMVSIVSAAAGGYVTAIHVSTTSSGGLSVISFYTEAAGHGSVSTIVPHGMYYRNVAQYSHSGWYELR